MADPIRVLHVESDGDGLDRSRLEDELPDTAILTSLPAPDARDRLASGTVDCLVVGEDESVLSTVVSEYPTVPVVRFAACETPVGSEAESIDIVHVDPSRPGAMAILAARIEAAVATNRARTLEATVDRDRDLDLDRDRPADTTTDAVALDSHASDRERIVTDHLIFESMLERLPVSLYVKDETATHIRASRDQVKPPIETPGGELLTEPDDLIGATDHELYASNLADDTVRDDRQVIETGEPIIDKLEQYEVGPGDVRWTTTSKVPWTDADGTIRGLVGATINVTPEIEHKQEIERQHEHLQEFASVVAHDLRNPLNIARGYVELAQHTGDTDLLSDVDSSLERMQRLIEDILLLARQGNAALTMTPVSLQSVVEEAWSQVSSDRATVHVETDVRFDADRGRLLQLFENVFRNAVDHGGETVAVTVEPLTADDGSGATVTVGFALEDDGPGIDPDERETVFESGYTTSQEGTGFGLAIVEQIVEAHDWEIDIGEGADGGVRFEVRGVDAVDG